MVHDWDEHLTRLSDFWSAVLLGTRRFAMPMPTHVAMPNLSAALFERWLALFGQTTAALLARWPTQRCRWRSAWRAASGTATS